MFIYGGSSWISQLAANVLRVRLNDVLREVSTRRVQTSEVRVRPWVLTRLKKSRRLRPAIIFHGAPPTLLGFCRQEGEPSKQGRAEKSGGKKKRKTRLLRIFNQPLTSGWLTYYWLLRLLLAYIYILYVGTRSSKTQVLSLSTIFLSFSARTAPFYLSPWKVYALLSGRGSPRRGFPPPPTTPPIPFDDGNSSVIYLQFYRSRALRDSSSIFCALSATGTMNLSWKTR